MNKKSQLSIELIVIMGVFIVIFTALLSMNIKGTQNQKQINNFDKINLALSEIYSSSEKVFMQGEGAKERKLIYLPGNIRGQLIYENSLIYNVSSGIQGVNQTISRKLDFNITGELPITEGYHWITVESFGGYVEIK